MRHTKGEISPTEFKDEENEKVEEDYRTPLHKVAAPDQGVGWSTDCPYPVIQVYTNELSLKVTYRGLCVDKSR